ncbi:hypothetical protein [Effusibacillus consociatus]|uniref:Uncharacterized protein n=1 Tax=Effusibacillus consociatus TaxID=1117041 RepID=A0ABV9Q6G0_9BACL
MGRKLGRWLSQFLTICAVFMMVFGVSSAATTNVIPGPDPITVNYPGTSIAAAVGDILISSNTRSSGLVGHAAIVDSNLNVQQMLGSPNKLSNGTQSISAFFADNNNQVKVMRFNDPAKALDAGRKAIDLVNWYGSDTYSLWDRLDSLSPTMYCTKFVWDCYYFGTGGASGGVNLRNLWTGSTAVSPYELALDSRLSKIYQSSNY